MQRVLVSVLLTIFFSACGGNTVNNESEDTDTSINIASDTTFSKNWAYQNEQKYLKRKKQLCNKLALYDIENISSDYELRMWLIPSMWDPSILYVLKQNDSLWTLFHYQFYTLGATDPNNYYDNPVVDSVVMESLSPQKTSWTSYINNLQLDSLWYLQTESSIKDKSFSVLDGYKYLLEFNKKGQYKYLVFTTPDYFQAKDENHKYFMEFKTRLIDPVVYHGMRNP